MRRVSTMWAAVVATAAIALTGCADSNIVADQADLVVPKAGLREPAAEGHLLSVTLEKDFIELTYEGQVPRFVIGDVVHGTEAPGYLRRVTSVDVNGSVVRLGTVAATIGDGYDQVHVSAEDVHLTPVAPIILPAVDLRIPLPAVNGQVFTVHLIHDPTPALRSATIEFAVEFPHLQLDIEDPSGAVVLSAKAEKLRVEKVLSLDFALQLDWFKVNELNFVVDDQTLYAIDKLSVEVTGELPEFAAKIPLFENPALVSVPVGPLVFTLGGGIELSVDALLSAHAEMHTTSDAWVKTHTTRGVTWDGSQLQPINEGDIESDGDCNAVAFGAAEANLDATLGFSGSLRFALYGLVGPELYGDVAPVIANASVGLDGWNLKLGASATGGIRFVLPGVPLDQFQYDFGTWEGTYYENSGGF